jgi:hypothetical protein
VPSIHPPPPRTFGRVVGLRCAAVKLSAALLGKGEGLSASNFSPGRGRRRGSAPCHGLGTFAIESLVRYPLRASSSPQFRLAHVYCIDLGHRGGRFRQYAGEGSAVDMAACQICSIAGKGMTTATVRRFMIKRCREGSCCARSSTADLKSFGPHRIPVVKPKDLIWVVQKRSNGSDSPIPFRRAHIAKEPLCLFKNNPRSILLYHVSLFS